MRQAANCIVGASVLVTVFSPWAAWGAETEAASHSVVANLSRAVLGRGGERESAQFMSGDGNLAFIGAGLLAPLIEDRAAGARHSLRVVDAFASSLVMAEGLKYITRERRPDGRGHDSFPSGHTTGAFAIATVESSFHPRQSPLWYGGAAAIGLSRLRLRSHFPHDVFFGAILGYVTARMSISRKRGLILSPIIGSRKSDTSLRLSMQF